MRIRFVVVLLASVAVVPPPARAADGSGWAEDDTINAQVQDGVPRTTASCVWRVVTATDPASGSVIEHPVQRTVSDGRETLHQRECTGNAGDRWYQWVRDSTKQRIVDRASSRASDRIGQLVFSSAPARDRNVVNVGTWFWVPRVLWKPVSATAYITTSVGVLSVTVTATPSRLRFDPGNRDDPVWCDGPGEPWRSALGDNAVSECMYTYRHAAGAGRRFPARTSVQWRLKVSSNFGLSFPLPNVTLGMTTPVTVREIQAVLGG